MKWQMGQATSLYLCVERGMAGMKQMVNQGLINHWGYYLAECVCM